MVDQDDETKGTEGNTDSLEREGIALSALLCTHLGEL